MKTAQLTPGWSAQGSWRGSITGRTYHVTTVGTMIEKRDLRNWPYLQVVKSN